jgi:hypothetical protein
VSADITASNPATPQVAEVWITDDGTLTYERDYWPEAAVISGEPQRSWHLTGTAAIVDDIVTTVTRAVAAAFRTVRAIARPDEIATA